MFQYFLASVVSSKMNFSVRPCDDFYQFACGRFDKTSIIPEDSGSVNTINLIEGRVMAQLNSILNSEIKSDDIRPFKMAKQMYRLCLNTSKSDYLLNVKKLIPNVFHSKHREKRFRLRQTKVEPNNEVASFDGRKRLGRNNMELYRIFSVHCGFLHRH